MYPSKRLHRCVILPSVNMARNTSGRIIISYSISPTNESYKYVTKVYLRYGPLVVSIANTRAATLHSTLRAMLTAIAMYPSFLRRLPSVRSVYILKSWVKAYCKMNARKYTKLPLSSLLDEALSSMAILQSSVYGGRVTLTSTRSVKDLLINLHVSYLRLIQYMNQRGMYSHLQSRVSSSRKKRRR